MQFPFVAFGIVYIAHAGDLLALGLVLACAIVGPTLCLIGLALHLYRSPRARAYRRRRDLARYSYGSPARSSVAASKRRPYPNLPRGSF